MRYWILAAAIGLGACGGDEPGGNPSSPKDMAGTMQSALDSAPGTPSPAPAPSTVDCTPGRAFCDGNAVWQCTRSGHDATLVQDCATVDPVQSQTNPRECSTDCGPVSRGACCKSRKPLCVWDLTSHSLSGKTVAGSINADGSLGCSQIQQACDADKVYVYFYRSNALQCSQAQGLSISLSIPKTAAPPGMVKSLPLDGVTLAVTDGGKSCYAWTGKVTVDAYPPAWKVTVDATCSEVGKTSMRVAGTFSGDN